MYITPSIQIILNKETELSSYCYREYIDRLYQLLIHQWSVQKAMDECEKYLQRHQPDLDQSTKQIIFREFCRICKYISYGYHFTNLSDLPGFPFPQIPQYGWKQL